MPFDSNRCRQIVRQQSANYPYLEDTIAQRLIGTIMSRRRKKVSITADFASALARCDIPLHQQRGYAQVAADYFNQKGQLIKHGSSYGVYKKRPAKDARTMQTK